MRDNYLAYIQRHAELINHPSPIGHGWEMIKPTGHCKPVRYTKVAFPAELPPPSSVSQIYLNQTLTNANDSHQFFQQRSFL